MGFRQSMNVWLYQEIEEGRVVYLGNIHFDATKQEVELLLKENGFNNYTFHWSEVSNNDSDDGLQEHDGWVQVEFNDQEAAKRAQRVFDDFLFHGRPLQVMKADDPNLDLDEHRPAVLMSDWIYDPGDPEAHRRAFFKYYEENLEEPYRCLGVTHRFLVTSDAQGRPKFHSCQIPNPAPGHNEAAATPHIAMIDETKTPVTIPLDRAEELKAEGWSVWDHPDNPLDMNNNERDLRHLERVNDIHHLGAAHNDTKDFFKLGLEIHSAINSKAKWEPGQIMGGDSAKNPAQDSPSLAPSFKPPAEQPNPRSATSSGFVHRYPRPGGVGAGWGDHDLFGKWQSYGRMIEFDMIPEIEWSNDMSDRPISVCERTHADGMRHQVAPEPTRRDPNISTDPTNLSKPIRRAPRSLFDIFRDARARRAKAEQRRAKMRFERNAEAAW
ncbi:hypothetical protein F4819DRAFT_475181 [Hypoxylon fuscum]|nr:hypothetical protein F4819DRAFT_475181 [Hypoxylon fuscum]